jgi:DnaJ like chaperone protein
VVYLSAFWLVANGFNSNFVTISFVTLVLYAAFKRNSNNRADAEWTNNVFSFHNKMNRDNLLEAYIRLGARLIQADRKDAGEKIVYMNRYFNKYFPKSNYDFGTMISISYRNPVRLHVVGKWMRMKMDKKRRIQVLYFLTGLSVIDGSINSREMKLLQELSNHMEISPKDFESVISMYIQRNNQKESPRSYSSKKSVIQLACKIIGVSEYASMDEIKKAYRALVKLHHPDRFVSESKEQQEIAKERFVEIQKAYEILEKHK